MAKATLATGINYVEWCIYTVTNTPLLFVTEFFHLREQWKGPPLLVRNIEVCHIRYTSGRCGNVWLAGLLNAMRSHFRTSPLLYATRKAGTMSNSANIVLSLWIQWRWHYESSRQWPHYVGIFSMFIFGGNFLLAKVCRGLISVRCLELRGVCFSEVRNVLVKSIRGKWAVCCTEVVRFLEGPLLEVLL